MLIVMKPLATRGQVESVCERVRKMGFKAHVIGGEQCTAVGVTGNSGEVDQSPFEELPGVAEVVRVTKPYKLVSREFHPENTIIRFDGTDASIGGQELTIIAGPCSVESREQIFTIAEHLASRGVRFLRGGAFKPRTSPYSFQGLGEEGLKLLAEVRDRFGMLIVTEAMDEHSLGLVERYADVIQIGSRNMQNYSLLKAVGACRKPVLLKRGMSATLEEYLLAAEYILNEGNEQVIFCERGVRTFADHSRNTMDLSVIPAAQQVSHLPILADPSHGTGRRDRVIPLSRAAVAVGADGLIVEVHHAPEKALSDGAQSLTLSEFDRLLDEVRQIAHVLKRTVSSRMSAAVQR